MAGGVEISVVISGRNDNWMGTFDRVTAACCQHNAELLARFAKQFEILFVEWAPLEDRPTLSTALVKIDPNVVCYVVPRPVHERLRPKLPFLQYHARNVGVRRANGRIVLATNADILLSEPVVQRLLALDDRTLLRTPRRDVSSRVLDADDLESRLRAAAANENLVIEHALWRTTPTGAKAPYWTNAAGDFIAMSRRAWNRVGGFHERTDASMGVDAEMIHQADAHRLTIEAIDDPIFHIDHEDQQPGRMRFPPYSRLGYQNPGAWGLRDALFEPFGERIYRCSPETVYAPIDETLRLADGQASSGPGRLLLHFLDAGELGSRAVIACPEGGELEWLADRLNQLKGETAKSLDEGLSGPGDAPALAATLTVTAPDPRAIFLVVEGSDNDRALHKAGAIEGLDFAASDPETGASLSFLRRWLRQQEVREIALVGFGQNGRYLHDRLQKDEASRDWRFLVHDGAADSIAEARRRGLTVLSREQLTRQAARIFLVTVFDPSIRAKHARMLDAAGLVSGVDYLVNGEPWSASAAGPTVRALSSQALPDQNAVTDDSGEWRAERGDHGAIYVHSSAGLKKPGTPFFFGGERRLTWPNGEFPRLDPFQPITSPTFGEPGWHGAAAPNWLSIVRARCVIEREWGGDGIGASDSLGLLLQALARQTPTGRWVHVGADPERAAALAAARTKEDEPVLSFELVAPWDPSPEPPASAPPGMRRIREYPEVAGHWLRDWPVSLLLLAGMVQTWELRESYAHFSPRVVDGGYVVIDIRGLRQGSALAFIETAPRLDGRFRPRLWIEDVLILERRKLGEG